MGWHEQRSKDRVERNDFHDFELDVQDLSRTKDFRKLGTTDVRRAVGVHMYIDVPNFHRAVEDAGNDKQKQRKLVRAASVLRKVQRELMDEAGVGDIQRQTVRLHALVYKPYDPDGGTNAGKRADAAVIHAVTQNTYVLDVFAEAFPDLKFGSAAGLSSGTSYIANIGRHGNRELISLGSSANLAAKVLGGRDTITITEDVYLALSETLRDEFAKSGVISGSQTYVAVGLRWDARPVLAEELGVTWDREKWLKKTEGYKDDLPLGEIDISDATVRIDIGSLTERNCKRTEAVALYADLDGFTRYVREAETDDKVVSLIRQFHMIRAEFHSVIGSDFEGLVIQHRGDCILAVLHMPCGDEHAKRCRKAVDIAIALQSSMTHVLNEHLPDRKDIHVAVGVDVGKAFVTRLGKQGRRVVICFGPEVMAAERLQMRAGAKQIRISQEVYDQLTDDDVKGEFEKSGASYIATGLTFPNIDRKQEEKAARAGRLGAAVLEPGRVAVTTAAVPNVGPWQTSRPWGPPE